MSMIWRGSRPIVGSSSTSTLGFVDQRLGQADALAEALRQVAEDPAR